MRVLKRIIRWITRLVSGLSLVLCVVVFGFMIRSKSTFDLFHFNRTDLKNSTWQGLDVATNTDYIWFHWRKFYLDRPNRAVAFARMFDGTETFRHWSAPSTARSPRGSFWNRLGFFGHNGPVVSDHGRDEEGRFELQFCVKYLGLPYWFMIGLLACGGVPLGLLARGAWMRRRRSPD